MRDIAGVIARRLGFGDATSIPIADGAAHFGRLVVPALNDNWVSSERTQALMGWKPKQASLIADLDSAAYFPEG
jgi:hypothetical protein